jgi:hypothetical protein
VTRTKRFKKWHPIRRTRPVSAAEIGEFLRANPDWWDKPKKGRTRLKKRKTRRRTRPYQGGLPGLGKRH